MIIIIVLAVLYFTLCADMILSILLFYYFYFRFAQFFISPLFDPSCIDREVNAVHSEHEKNVMSDEWRVEQLDKENSDPTHDYSKFGTGKFILLVNKL